MPGKNHATALAKQNRPVKTRFEVLSMLASHHHQKHRIKIIEAGQTPIGRVLITIDRVKWLKKTLERVEEWRNNYAAFILDIGWYQECYVQTPQRRIYLYDITELKTIVTETNLCACSYTSTEPEVRERIVADFNDRICKNAALHQLLNKLIFDQLTNEFDTLDNIRLSGVINVSFEINYLRWNLAADTSLGYVVANNHEHVDHFLISRSRVITPLSYSFQPYFGADAYADLLSEL